jgi:hypothetical protein
MIPHQFYYQLAVLGFLWLCVLLHLAWPSRGVTTQTQPAKPITPRRQRSTDPKPFTGLTHKPPCALCEQEAAHPKASPPGRPEPMPPTHRRPRTVDTSRHFCPHTGWRYRGWLGLGNLRANGLPTICQAECVTFFAPSTRPAYNEFGWNHSPYDHAAWPSGYAGVGRQYCVRPGHAAAPSPATPHTRC